MFQLRLALKYLKCPYLDKRVIGLLEIKGFIQQCTQRDECSQVRPQNADGKSPVVIVALDDSEQEDQFVSPSYSHSAI